ncbi:MAG: ABC transporter substrate-binding protein, partial [Pseudomonadota bacterium]
MQTSRTSSRQIRACIAAFLSSLVLSNPVFAASDIRMVQIGPFTVLPESGAAQVNQGIKAFVESSNKTAINGKKFVFSEADDRFSADEFVTQFGKAIDAKSLALVSPMGSNSVKRMLDDKLLDTADTVDINAIPGAESFRSPGHPKLFHIRAGDKLQIEKIITHIRTLGIKRVSVFYENLPVGVSGLAVAQQVAARSEGVEIKGVKSGTAATELATAAQQAAAQNPQGVLIVGTPRFMAESVGALRKAGVSQALFVLSYVPAALIVKIAGPDGARGVGIAQTFPNPNGRTQPVVMDFQVAMKAAFPQV